MLGIFVGLLDLIAKIVNFLAKAWGAGISDFVTSFFQEIACFISEGGFFLGWGVVRLLILHNNSKGS
jgi:hypothetical protein